MIDRNVNYRGKLNYFGKRIVDTFYSVVPQDDVWGAKVYQTSIKTTKLIPGISRISDYCYLKFQSKNSLIAGLPEKLKGLLREVASHQKLALRR